MKKSMYEHNFKTSQAEPPPLKRRSNIFRSKIDLRVAP